MLISMLVPSRHLSGVVLGLVLLLAGACQSDEGMPPSVIDKDDLYWNLVLDHHAVTMSTTAPYDTLTVTATPRNYQGAPLAGLPVPRYTTGDVTKVQVTPEGTLVALAPTSRNVIVYATLTVGTLTQRDSVLVQVVNNSNPPILASLSIHPVPPDSAKIAAVIPRLGGSIADLSRDLSTLVRATSTTGAPMTNLVVDFRSSDTTIATTFNNAKWSIRGFRVGDVDIYATATVFGVTKADTLPYRIGFPLTDIVHVRPIAPGALVNYFAEAAPKIAVGGAVVWQSDGTTVETDVVFTDPTNVIATDSASSTVRNIPAVAIPCLAYPGICAIPGNFVLPSATDAPSSGYTLVTVPRVFPVPGVYEYHSALHGTSGKVIVVDES